MKQYEIMLRPTEEGLLTVTVRADELEFNACEGTYAFYRNPVSDHLGDPELVAMADADRVLYVCQHEDDGKDITVCQFEEEE